MNDLLKKASVWFAELSIQVSPQGNNCLKVNRNDMYVMESSDGSETKEFIEAGFLRELRKHFNTNKFSWLSKDDTWAYLEVF